MRDLVTRKESFRDQQGFRPEDRGSISNGKRSDVRKELSGRDGAGSVLLRVHTGSIRAAN